MEIYPRAKLLGTPGIGLLFGLLLDHHMDLSALGRDAGKEEKIRHYESVENRLKMLMEGGFLPVLGFWCV